MARPVIFWSDDSPEGLRDAKEYIRRFSLTRDDVSLVQKEGQTIVFAKRNIADKLKNPRPKARGVCEEKMK
jgi:hypothetical protein